MAVKQKVYRVGTALVITIPSQFAKMLNITEGTQVEIFYEKDRLIVKFLK